MREPHFLAGIHRPVGLLGTPLVRPGMPPQWRRRPVLALRADRMWAQAELMLTRDFFQRLAGAMPTRMLLVAAEQGGPGG